MTYMDKCLEYMNETRIFAEDLYSDIKVDKVVITCFWYLRTCLLQLRQGLAN